MGESGVGQGISDVMLEGKSILENVCLGMQDTTREILEEACRVVIAHNLSPIEPWNFVYVLKGVDEGWPMYFGAI